MPDEPEVPLDDRGIQIEKFITRAAGKIAGIPIENLAGASMVYATRTAAGFQVFEEQVGSVLAINCALLQAAIDGLKAYRIRPEYLQPMADALDALLLAYAGTKGPDDTPAD